MGFAVALALWGRSGTVSTAAAAPPQVPDNTPSSVKESSDYSKRVVAYVYDNVALTREDFGEYLIARCAVDERLNNMVNRFIIEHEAKLQGIQVTAAEVEAEFKDSIKGISTNEKDFVDKILLPYHKTLYEWKEDVIKPRLMLMKMCRHRVAATEEDIKTAYEAYYGEKIHCRIIKWKKSDQNLANAIYPRIRDNEKEFDEVARHQFTAELAAKGGDVPPFGHNNTGNLDLEKAAFALKPGEVTALLETPDSFVVLKCVERIPASHTKTLEEARAMLTEDIINRKINQLEIPVLFAELRKKANPKLLLRNGPGTADDLMNDVRKELTPVGVTR
jgi:hypothetical protein